MIINAHHLPDHLTYLRIPPTKLREVFDKGERFPDSLAQLLLDHDETAVYHMDSTYTGMLGGDPSTTFVHPVLLGANYHPHGHSEGRYKIIVQDVVNRCGPWVLIHPPGSQETTFYLQNFMFPNQMPPEFKEDVANLLKIKKRFLHLGNPLEIFKNFEAAGFHFVDEPMTEEYLDRTRYFENNA